MSTEMITCPSCGNQMPANAGFCPNCGHANASATAPGLESWQPGQYNAVPGPQGQPQFAPAPAARPFQPYGSQSQPPVQAYTNDPQLPINYQYQSQVGVA